MVESMRIWYRWIALESAILTVCGRPSESKMRKIAHFWSPHFFVTYFAGVDLKKEREREKIESLVLHLNKKSRLKK